MIIVIARDETLRSWAHNPQSGSGAWHSVWGIPKESTQSQATAALKTAIHGLPVNEPICISGHGHDEEIGDENSGPKDWGWDVAAFAKILSEVNPRTGPLLLSTCAERVSNFAARLALELQRLGKQDGLWIFGYNRSLSVKALFPDPGQLFKDDDLQWTQVG